MRYILRTLVPLCAAAGFCLSVEGRAETEPTPETRLLAEWDGAEIEVTPYDSYDVYLVLRVQHGEDEWYIEDGPHRVTDDQTSVLSVPWPNLSHKGRLMGAPATVTGALSVVALDGGRQGSVNLEPRLWWADAPDATVPQEELGSYTALVVEEGLALAGADPEAFVDAEVTP